MAQAAAAILSSVCCGVRLETICCHALHREAHPSLGVCVSLFVGDAGRRECPHGPDLLGTAILNANRKLRGLHVKSDYEALSLLAGVAEEMGGEEEVLHNAAVERIAQQANSASAPR